MARHVVGRVSELPAGSRTIVEVGDGDRTVGVFNVNGRFFALLNRCPHQAAPLCRGAIKGTALPSEPGQYVWGREGEILRCPWHGWEFDITNGRSIFNPHRLRVRTYEVTIEPVPDANTATEAASEDERVETFPVTVEDGWVVVHA